MAGLEKRLEMLEEAFAEARGEEAANLERRLLRAALWRVSIVEMCVMGELREAYRANPGLSPAEVWRKLTEAQRAMQARWLDATREAARGMLAAGEDLTEEQEGELRELVRDVGNYPFFEEGR